MIKFLAGWKHRESEGEGYGPYKQMYVQKGGGVFTLEGNSDDDWDFMFARLKSLFFPNGKNGPLSLEDLKCSLGSYVGDEIPRFAEDKDKNSQPFRLDTYSELVGKQIIRIYLLTTSSRKQRKTRKRAAATVTVRILLPCK